MKQACAAALLCLWVVQPAVAQSQAEGQMRLYILQLEERVRQLTGQNERLAYEVNQLRTQLGMPPLELEQAQAAAEVPTGALATGESQPAGSRELGTLTVNPDGGPAAPVGPGMSGEEQPVDLSTLAGGVAPELVREFGNPNPAGQEGEMETAGLAGTPPTISLSGSASDEFALAYGYVLTGDYDLAEESFKTWLATFPGDQQAADARFWLGESHLQQGEYRDAADAFLGVYKTAPDRGKGPDALLKLGVSLAALGETKAACATLSEVGRRYPDASPSIMSRVHDEESRAGC